MWVKARIEGGKLVVKAEERQSPPTIVKEDEPCDLVAKKMVKYKGYILLQEVL